MTAAQMSHEFDLLWNNIMSNQAPGLSEYEKSVFLTKAQDEIVKNYLVPQSPGNLLRAGVEDIPKRHTDFSSLIVNSTVSLSGQGSMHSDGVSGELPDDYPILAILSETAEDLAVRPLDSEEFLRLMSKPYKYPLKGQCWRLMHDDGTIEVVAPYGTTISSYNIRYVKRPHPIITGTLPSGIKFEYNGSDYDASSSGAGDSEVPESLHEDIVQRAVELAKGVWSSSDNFVAMGRRTE